MRRHHRPTTTLALVAALALAGCAAPLATGESAVSSAPEDSASTTVSAPEVTSALFTATEVHTIDVTVDEDTLTGMIQTYLDTGEKEWIRGTVTIDGQTFEDVGLKLKGNSSLRGISTDTPAQQLPLRIRLDKFVDDQTLEGYSDVTVRSNTTETSLNEAVSLDVLSAAGLASTEAVATRFSVNGSEEELRLTVQNLDDAWVTDAFPEAGEDSVLYKSEAEGDWSWRGEDGDYSTAFDIEAGEDDYRPLIELLDLLHHGTEEEIAQRLPELVDLESFATYLAVQEIIQNTDDIDGPGNNSYLFWDSSTEQFTVVAWDHNLSFGAMKAGGGPGGGGAGGGMPTFEDGQVPEGLEPPAVEEGEMPEGVQPPGVEGDELPGGRSGTMSRSHPLVETFLADEEWAAAYEAELTRLRTALVEGGVLEQAVSTWTTTLEDGAGDLLTADQIEDDADAVLTVAE
ncbi:CotH kinase family protein [Serinicoccus marinus]|uniref:CotH kinase family protein n=1 Tax=Serinicoccus marinus TaxID=247333 RepID=UPI0003B4D317|nr:CotH kinase family protein [Serinicoccus marinus]